MDIDKLIVLNIEIEGLLRVLKAHASPEAKNLLVEKTDEFAALVFEEFTVSDDLDAEIDSLLIEPEEEIDEHEEEATATAEPLAGMGAEDPAPEPEPLADTGAEGPAPEPEPMRVDEMISRKEAVDLSKAFTINDKFRFARELFDNDRDELNKTIAYVSTIPSLSDAYDYFFNELGWDADNEAVADFLSVIANHFNETK